MNVHHYSSYNNVHYIMYQFIFGYTGNMQARLMLLCCNIGHILQKCNNLLAFQIRYYKSSSRSKGHHNCKLKYSQHCHFLAPRIDKFSKYVRVSSNKILNSIKSMSLLILKIDIVVSNFNFLTYTEV